jgi:hypothetical protein
MRPTCQVDDPTFDVSEPNTRWVDFVPSQLKIESSRPINQIRDRLHIDSQPNTTLEY